MTHRYGRHGDKAWLRWRKKRFQHVDLTLAPQVAVLYVPLEFLSRIRKVTILMSDGTEETIQPITPNPLPPRTIDADTEPRLNGLGRIQSLQDRFYAAAKETARDQAERNFHSTIDPYSAKPDVLGARSLAQFLYYGNDQTQFSQNWRLSEAQESFIRVFKDEYRERLAELSREYEASTEETQQLLIFARTDKDTDRNDLPLYAQYRALARASICLFSNTSLRQEDVNEEVLSDLRKRIGLYQKFYDEFEPTKEED